MGAQFTWPLAFTIRGEDLSFASADQLKGWLNQELNNWRTMIPEKNQLLKHAPLTKLRSISEKLSNALARLGDTAADDANASQRAYQAMVNSINSLNQDVYAISSRPEIIEAAKTEDDDLRLSMLYFLTGGELRLNDAQHHPQFAALIKGMVSSECLKRGMVPLNKATGESFEVLRAEMQG